MLLKALPKVAVAISVLVLSSCVAVSSEEASVVFENCDQVRSEFPSGVAADSSELGSLIIRPVKNQAGYQAAASLDSNGDGIVCEFPNPAKVEGQPEPGAAVNSSSFFFFRYDSDGNLERSGNNGTPWGKKSFDGTTISTTRLAAYENIRSLSAADSATDVNWVIGENVPPDMLQAYELQTAEFLSRIPFPEIEVPLDLLIFTEKDRTLIEQYWAGMWAGESVLRRHTAALEGYESERGSNWSVGGMSEVRHPRDGSFPVVGVDFYMSSKHTQETSLLGEHVAHELFHAWQWSAVRVPEKIAAGTRYDISDFVPCHAMEGAAVTIGTAILMPYPDWFSDAADVVVRRVANQTGVNTVTEETVIELMEKGESWSDCSEAYAIGMLAYEWLIGEYGADKFLELYVNAGKSISFSENLEELYGFGKDEFYRLAAPHITQEFNRAQLKQQN